MNKETPTMDEVLKRNGINHPHEDAREQFHLIYKRTVAAMTEWEQLTSAPLLAKIEELEERDHYNDRVVLDLQQKLLATLPMKQRISELEKERDELKSLVSDMGKHTNEVVCKHNILVEEIESLKKENERLKRLVPDHPKANS